MGTTMLPCMVGIGQHGYLVNGALTRSLSHPHVQVTGGAPNKLSKIKVVRKSVARVMTVYRQNQRAALKNKITEEAKNAKGKVSNCYFCAANGASACRQLEQHSTGTAASRS